MAVIPPAEVASLAHEGENTEEAVECFRARLHETGVQFSAISKHGDYEFTTEVIPLDLLQQAAGGISELDRLEALAISLGLKDGDLDEAVTDLYVGFVGVPAMNETADESGQDVALSDAEHGASEVNNNGLRAQISWLLENAHGGVEEAIRDAAGEGRQVPSNG